MADEITLDAPETRIERFLAAAAGVDGITLDEPVTRIEKYLYKIAQGSGGVPAVEDADKGKYLHANESTGDLEWAEGGSGGGSGVELVRFELEFDGVAFTPVVDHTVAEIDAAREAGKLIIGLFGETEQMAVVSYSGDDDYPYSAVFYIPYISVNSLIVTKRGFYYEEGAWVHNKNTIEIQTTHSSGTND